MCAASCCPRAPPQPGRTPRGFCAPQFSSARLRRCHGVHFSLVLERLLLVRPFRCGALGSRVCTSLSQLLGLFDDILLLHGERDAVGCLRDRRRDRISAWSVP